jgi:hypothetical protein
MHDPLNSIAFITGAAHDPFGYYNMSIQPSHTIHPDLILSHLHSGFWKKIVTLSRVIGIITREFYTKKIGFKLLGDNIKVFY